jgi:hypothetical protein
MGPLSPLAAREGNGFGSVWADYLPAAVRALISSGTAVL